MMKNLPKSEREWKVKLSPEQYDLLRNRATEAPFSGKLLNNKESGKYLCAACGSEIFSSDTKFDSGSGWPSFFEAKPGSIELKEDNDLGMRRIEVICKKCRSHLGHLFNDAPQTPTGKRYCVNSGALNFKIANTKALNRHKSK